MRSKLLALLAASAMLFSAKPAMGARRGATDVSVTNAWARATPGGAETAAAYVTLESPAGDRLMGISTPAAQKAEVHSMTMEGSVMKMRSVDGLDLPPGQTVTLKPGGYHIMMTGLAKPLEAGESFPLTLTFAKAGAKNVTVSVEKIGAMGPGGAASSGGDTNMPGMTMPMRITNSAIVVRSAKPRSGTRAADRRSYVMLPRRFSPGCWCWSPAC